MSSRMKMESKELWSFSVDK